MKTSRLIKLIMCFTVINEAYALRPIDSLIFGPGTSKIISKNKNEEKDPLEFVFYEDSADSEQTSHFAANSNHKKRLAMYSSYIHEGQNLKNRCDRKYSPLKYKSTTEYSIVKRTYLTTLQETGLNLVSSYLPLYADYFEFTNTEYENLVDSLVGNYCSQNLSFISLRELRKNMISKFITKENLELPSVLGNPYFPDKLERLSSLTDVKKKEFYYTIELFKGLCSWGGQTHDYRLMTPLVSHPAIAAMVMRKLTSKNLTWDNKKEKIILSDNNLENKPEKIVCENYICRKTKERDFERLMPKSIGSLDLRYDLEKLFCSEFADADYKIKNQLPKIKKEIKEKTFFARHSLAGQFVALSTSIPDFLMHVKANQDMDELYRASMDRSWKKWAQLEKSDRVRSLFFEESLVIEAKKRDLRELYKYQDIQVDLQIGLGEYDRIGGDLGKIGATFTIPIKKEFLLWAIKQVKSVNTQDEIFKLTHLSEKTVARVRYVLRDIERKLNVVPWSGKEGLDRVIANSIISQLPHYEVATNGALKDIAVKVSLNYGVFALGYVRDIQQIQMRENSRLKESITLKKMASIKD